MSDDANDFLMDGGAKGASFKGSPPIAWTGTVVSKPTQRQKTEYKPGGGGEPLFWKDGSPQMQVVVKVQTDVRDPEVPDDDGVRAFYLDGRRKSAVRNAVLAAGEKGLLPGGSLTLTYTSDDYSTGADNPPKNFSATYAAPNPLAADGPAGQVDPWATGPPGGGGWQAQAPPPQPAPVQAPAPAPVPAASPTPAGSGVNPQLVAALAAKGVTVTPDMTQDTAVMIAKSLGVQPPQQQAPTGYSDEPPF